MAAGVTGGVTGGAAGAAAAAAVGVVGVAEALDLSLPPCPLRALTGLPCPGCGSARCIADLLDGDLAAAVDHNLLVPIALIVVMWAGVAAAARRAGHPLWDPLRHRWASMAVAVTIAGFWLLRLVPVGPGPWLAP